MKAFTLNMPDVRTTSVVFASPHSGRDYPWTFVRRSVLDERTLRSSEDAFVDQLFASAPEHGAPLLSATMPRAWLDVNRAADELDGALIDGVRKGTHNPRVASGLGVVPRVVANGRSIYRGKISQREAEGRIRDVWRPWHDALGQLLVRHLVHAVLCFWPHVLCSRFSVFSGKFGAVSWLWCRGSHWVLSEGHTLRRCSAR